MRLPSPLLLITDRQQARNPLVEIIEAALRHGCRCVSLREKDLSASERLALVKEIAPLVHGFGGTLLVHADIHAAELADGVHLPAGANVGEARKILGDKSIIGLSCHTLEDVSLAHGADYVTLGPFAPTASKPGYLPSFGPEILERAAKFGVPVVALGGVDETNVARLRRAGAMGFALMGSVMRHENAGVFVGRMLEMWNEAASP